MFFFNYGQYSRVVSNQEWVMTAGIQYIIYKGTTYKARNPRFVITLVKKWVSMYVVDQKKLTFSLFGWVLSLQQ